MALTPTQEAQVLQLVAEQAALLSLADNEATIISKLGATKVNLSSLGSAASFDDADIMLIRQGTTDLSIAGSVIKTAVGVPDASETVKGKVELATLAEAEVGTNSTNAMTPATTGALFPFRGIQVYDTPGVFNWAWPTGVTKAYVIVVAGGAGGGRGAAQDRAAGGSAGGASMGLVTRTGGDTEVTVTVGSGGATSTSGGSSSFGGYMSASGGSGPPTNVSAGPPGVGVGGDIRMAGEWGSDSPVAPGGGGSGAGGNSIFGGAGKSSSSATAVNGGAPGAGGGGTSIEAAVGGLGAAGVVIIKW